MAGDFLLDRLVEFKNRDALIWNDQSFTYGWLAERVTLLKDWLDGIDCNSGDVVSVEGDFSPISVALVLALMNRDCVLVPLTESVASRKSEFIRIAEVEVCISIDRGDQLTGERQDRTAEHVFYKCLRKASHPGLVLFSSGSTGEPKAAVHDLVPLLEKFEARRKSLRTISFLLYDHIGGINTLLHTLANGGTLVTVSDRRPETVLRSIQNHKVELLPTSPTFLNLILLSDAYRDCDLSCLKLVTYGTEMMPAETLERIRQALPGAEFRQTYGLSEVGILRSKSKSSDSLWVRIGGEGFDTRIVEGVLHIKAKSAMMGYLNAPSPFTDDGWLNTGDLVEQDGEFIRFLGRKSETINVGGEKVFPAEVEGVIQELPEVAEASVFGEANPIVGQMVCADITPANPEVSVEELALIIKAHCAKRLERFKVPIKVSVLTDPLHNARFKKLRRH